jgi:hypothetical protein
MADIYIRRLFRKRGPYTEEEVRSWIREGKISPGTSAWREGMTDWKPLSEWGFLTAAASPRRRFQPGKRRNYDKIDAEEPGYGRLRYVLMNVAVNAVIVLALWAVSSYMASLNRAAPDFMKDVGIGNAGSLAVGSLVHIVLALCCSLWVATKRMENIGWHWGWALLTLVPLLNVFVALALIALPPGFAIYKKLDLVAWLWVLLVAAIIGFTFSVPNLRDVIERARKNAQEALPSSITEP